MLMSRAISTLNTLKIHLIMVICNIKTQSNSMKVHLALIFQHIQLNSVSNATRLPLSCQVSIKMSLVLSKRVRTSHNLTKNYSFMIKSSTQIIIQYRFQGFWSISKQKTFRLPKVGILENLPSQLPRRIKYERARLAMIHQQLLHEMTVIKSRTKQIRKYHLQQLPKLNIKEKEAHKNLSQMRKIL